MTKFSRFVFVCNDNCFNFSEPNVYVYNGKCFSDAFFQFVKENTSSCEEKVNFFHHFISENAFKYILVKEDGSVVGTSQTVEVYEE